jgi:hypothetical protein
MKDSLQVRRNIREHKLNMHELLVNVPIPQSVVQFCQDLQHSRDWNYEELPPVRLLNSLKLDRYPPDSDELARAEWMWLHRESRLFSVTSSLLWFILAFGTPFWICIPAVGLPLLTVWAVMASIEIVRSTRWRRDYEISIARLIRKSGFTVAPSDLSELTSQDANKTCNNTPNNASSVN